MKYLWYIIRDVVVIATCFVVLTDKFAPDFLDGIIDWVVAHTVGK